MSTNISPLNRQRSNKITGGRARCAVYLPQDELKEIEKISQETGLSQSSVIAKFYFLGKKNANPEQTED